MKCKETHFGACKQCHMHLRKVLSRDAITSPAPNSIVSWLATGYVPDVLTYLNSVELVPISSARVNQHTSDIFVLWWFTQKNSWYHCLHYNNCNETNRVGSWMLFASNRRYRDMPDCKKSFLLT